MKTFLPEDYEAPAKTGGNYFKFQDGANKFRVLGSAITGWSYWTEENKPVRLRKYPEEMPANIRQGDKLKHFWAFPVWSYRDNSVQIMEVTQASIREAMQALVESEDWGDPKGYDITVTRSGQKLDTTYTVQPSPHKPIPAQAADDLMVTTINLNALYEGGDPFEAPKPKEATARNNRPNVVKERIKREEGEVSPEEEALME